MPSVFARPNKFKGLSYHNNLNCDMGYLIPCYKQEVVPGDEFKVSADTVVRLMPMLAPVYGEMNLWIHFFFVPNRLLWSNFEDFVTNGLENGTTTAVHPYVVGGAYNATNWQIGDLTDYLSCVGDGTTNSVEGKHINALPFRAYVKIYNDWYRNEFLDSEVAMSTSDGQDTTTSLGLLKRNWKRDYFTSGLPFRQLGSPVALPLGTSAPVSVYGNGKGIGLEGRDGTDVTHEGLIAATSNAIHRNTDAYGRDIGYSAGGGSSSSVQSVMGLTTDATKSGVVGLVDLSSATAATINDLRTAFQLQRIMERKARSGNRYVEYIASSFGVRSPDARLQRAEFLGGGRAPIMVSEVLQTSAATSTSPLGQFAGHGFGASRTFAFNKAFTEHGWILGILSVMPKPSYFQGIPRDMIKETWTDYYQPELAHLGEQAVYKEEIFSVAAASDTDARQPLCYQPMYQHMRSRPAEVHGDFRGNLNYWTLSRKFASRPAFNSGFVDCDASGIQANIFAAGALAVRPVLVEMQFNVKAIRPLPKHGNPGLIDH